MAWQLPFMGLVKEGISAYREKKKAKHELAVAGIKQRAKLVSDENSNNHEWELRALEDSDKWIRRISFTAFFAPFVVAIFAPEHVAIYFNEGVASIDEWWRNAYIAITGSVWGISSMKNVFAEIIGVALKKASKK